MHGSLWLSGPGIGCRGDDRGMWLWLLVHQIWRRGCESHSGKRQMDVELAASEGGEDGYDGCNWVFGCRGGSPGHIVLFAV